MTEQEEKSAPAEESSSGVISRRSLLVGLGGTAVLCGLGAVRYVAADPLVRPPGGQNDDQLVSACIHCEKCYEVCPRNVIAPAHIENGIVNMRTPVMTYSQNWCDWCKEENGGDPLCVKVCPTQALQLPQGATPENTILGIADLDTDLCLAYRLIGCRFCYDACEYDAIELDENNRPYVIDDKCNGCGACESVCVSMQNGSITAGANRRAIIVEPVK